MYRLVKGCKTKEEAIEKSGMYVGQPARVKAIYAHGNVEGVWTLIPRVELLEFLGNQNSETKERESGKEYTTRELRRRVGEEHQITSVDKT